jgi:hypothetical protein
MEYIVYKYKSISTNAPYVNLQKYFSHPSFINV